MMKSYPQWDTKQKMRKNGIINTIIIRFIIIKTKKV